jgi:murein tripeptide amidase MpaA
MQIHRALNHFLFLLWGIAVSTTMLLYGCVSTSTASRVSLSEHTATTERNTRAQTTDYPALKSTHYDPPGSTQTTDKPIFLMTKRTITIPSAGAIPSAGVPSDSLFSVERTVLHPSSHQRVYASNEFDGGRLHNFWQQDDSTFVALIAPENAPINSSAWYALKMWSDSARTITLHLHYREGKHRYRPKIYRSVPRQLSRQVQQRQRWQWIDTSQDSSYAYTVSGTTASIRLRLGEATQGDTVWIAAQELLSSAEMEQWASALTVNPATASFVRKSILGRSVMSRPLMRLDISAVQPGAEDGYVVLLCRQHPPEVPGAFAFMKFVETLSDTTELARRFRARFRTIAVPLLNPDGVDMGHWRHNAHGVDLNRDWFTFHQPETRQVAQMLLEIKRDAEQRGKRILFGIDFHSTSEDVFYIIPVQTNEVLAKTFTSVPAEAPTEAAMQTDALRAAQYQASYQRIQAWLKRIQALVPHYKVNADESPENLETPSSNRWMNRELAAATTTYEVGDNTDRLLINEVASAAARAMMELCLAEQ